jgi:hypothetical protein
MNKACFLVLGTVMALGSALFAGAGCSSPSSGSGGSGGGAASSSASTTGSTSSAATTSSSTGGAMATCAGYCTAVMANCKVPMDPGSTQQYKDMTSCLNVCKTFPQGTIGGMGDNLECRNYHAGVAQATPALHCEHAGPTGGAKSGAAADDGPCGNGCEAFCNLAVPTCKTQAVDMATCKTLCNGYAKSPVMPPYSVTYTTKNDFECRMYHLSVAATDAASATMHCPHILAVSAACNM